MHFRLRFSPILGLAGILIGAEAPWPTAGWQTATPAEQGLDGARLEAFSTELAGERHGYIDGMLVVRHGKVVFQREYHRDYEEPFRRSPDQKRGPYNYHDPEWHPFRQGTSLHTMQSISKSVTATLIAIAMQRGELKGIDAPVMTFFPFTGWPPIRGGSG